MMELKICWKLKREKENVEEKLKCVDDSLNRMTPYLDGLPNAKSADDRLARLIAEKLELENQLASLKEKLISAQVELIGGVLKVKGLTVDEENILIRRYGFCDDWAAITAAMCFSENHVFRLHRQALKKL
ncbi:MAG: hypothetical protein IJS29_04875 [Selenomonadaceae bacterium]|nr:hypothetical protein [Selenomonadaceae bacterium]